MRAGKKARFLVSLLHEPLACRHLHTGRWPRGAGVRQRCSMTLTMPPHVRHERPAPAERQCGLLAGGVGRHSYPSGKNTKSTQPSVDCGTWAEPGGLWMNVPAGYSCTPSLNAAALGEAARREEGLGSRSTATAGWRGKPQAPLKARGCQVMTPPQSGGLNGYEQPQGLPGL
jgi:hypothetical protein